MTHHIPHWSDAHNGKCAILINDGDLHIACDCHCHRLRKTMYLIDHSCHSCPHIHTYRIEGNGIADAMKKALSDPYTHTVYGIREIGPWMNSKRQPYPPLKWEADNG